MGTEFPSKWDAILRSITAPVILFGLAFLVLVTGVIGTACSGHLNAQGEFFLVLGGGILFLILVLAVFLLVWFKPENIMFSEAGHLKKYQLMAKQIGKEAKMIKGNPGPSGPSGPTGPIIPAPPTEEEK